MGGLTINRPKVAEGHVMVSDRRLYLTSDRSRLVEDGDPEAAYLFATIGSEIAAADVVRYELEVAGGKVVVRGAVTAPKEADVEQPAPSPSKPMRARFRGGE